ncbi:hypothetical protein IT409_00925 [Candidatus Falkowbacteria bacterium]|nr:hypothetical protein [Candidatus Falkowbacteria bacterium]
MDQYHHFVQLEKELFLNSILNDPTIQKETLFELLMSQNSIEELDRIARHLLRQELTYSELNQALGANISDKIKYEIYWILVKRWAHAIAFSIATKFPFFRNKIRPA